MQKDWLIKENNDSLLIYILGWASYPDLISHIKIQKYDILCIYNFREIEILSHKNFLSYKKIIVIAWSFGVWVAERILQNIPIDYAIAFNGTPHPVNAIFGIHPRILLLTIQKLTQLGIITFNEKTFGGKEKIPFIESPERSLNEKIEELSFLNEQSQINSIENINWNKAFISSEDLIFPPKSMITYWKTRGIGTIIKTPHYPFADTNIILNELKNL